MTKKDKENLVAVIVALMFQVIHVLLITGLYKKVLAKCKCVVEKTRHYIYCEMKQFVSIINLIRFRETKAFKKLVNFAASSINNTATILLGNGIIGESNAYIIHAKNIATYIYNHKYEMIGVHDIYGIDVRNKKEYREFRRLVEKNADNMTFFDFSHNTEELA